MAVTCVGDPGARQLPPRSDLVPAVDALLRGQLGDEPVAVRARTAPPRRSSTRSIVKAAPIVGEQLAKLYDRETAELLLYKGLAFRSMHAHGRALNGLLARAVEDVESYDVREGEVIAGVVLGYNFGDGHFHNEQLLAAVQERCHFAEGELRVVMIESQPAHIQRQHYRIYDAATGLIEQGYVRVADMVERQPWLEESGAFPVEVIGSAPTAAAAPVQVSEAIVVGSGPNGLVCAARARARGREGDRAGGRGGDRRRHADAAS